MYHGATIPLWYDEGFAELVAEAGTPYAARIAELRRGRMLSLATLTQVDSKSHQYHQSDQVSMFYSESWGLVRMLYTDPAYAPQLPRFLGLLFAGTPALEAFDQVYHETGEQVLAELTSYIQRERWPATALELRPLEPATILRRRRLTRAGSGAILADLLIDLGQADRAAEMLRKLARSIPVVGPDAGPDWAAVEIALADVALAMDQRRQAIGHYRRAIASGTSDARAYLELATLLRDDGAEPTGLIPLLEKAAALDPGYRDAQELLRSIRERAQPAEKSARVPTGPDVITPRSWQNPQGDARVEGKLIRLDCGESTARLHVAVEGRELVLAIGDPHKVVIRNAPGMSTVLNCGAMEQFAVVEYVAATGEITAIELRK